MQVDDVVRKPTQESQSRAGRLIAVLQLRLRRSRHLTDRGSKAGTVVFLRIARHAKTRWALTATLLTLLLWNMAAVAQQRPGHKRPAKVVQPAPDPLPAPPPPPPTLEQMPAVPPKVRFIGGQLTIVAENSTLAEILRAVHTQTGAVIEVPPNATERVATHLGPGPARDVLATLLNGSHFNYVMVGSPTHPDSVDRLILTSKAGGEPVMAPVAPAAPGNNEAQIDESGTQGIDIAEQPVDDPAQNANENQQPNPAQVKTPEQLLRELQLQQQQQQQQQPAAAAPEDGQPRPN